MAALCARCIKELPGDYELLICYDFDEDNTLAALAAMPDAAKPAGLRLVRNRLGRGVRYAIEAGLRAAQTEVAVVTMADLSDTLTSVEPMVRLAVGGHAVVAGSRYMPGGWQTKGPWLKSQLSRMAGLTLHWCGKLPTHDATNSFKAYRTDFLKSVIIESKAGFSLGLELVVKAHLAGLAVAEVPAGWIDRTAGQSRFRMWAWMPQYLKWWWMGMCG